MNLRYLSFPKSPCALDKPERRAEPGYGSISSERMTNQVAMLSLSQYFPLADTGGIAFGFFYDHFSFSGTTGAAILAPSFGAPDYLPESFVVNVNSVSGTGYHAGLSGAYVSQLKHGARFQVGLSVERLDVGEYRVAFSTVDLASNFDGAVDYAGVYNILAPFASYEGKRKNVLTHWIAGPHAIVAWPLPRTGFKGRFTGPGFDIQSDTDANGIGKHIPDPYVGLGYFLEHRRSGVRVDIGASLYHYVVEPLLHTGIDPIVSVNVSVAF
jgi:hypothetical protein